ncbi:hypothetical protein QIS74_03440 [Colletotrichum tabaci]|uniref:Uncharacterized protein n=1 Tax=Colletotrichum tabaci TaxID=1209068 RepID=A0AAV9TKJ3_9PEZI
MLSPIYANLFDRDHVPVYISHGHDDGQRVYPETQQHVPQSNPSLPIDVTAYTAAPSASRPIRPPPGRPYASSKPVKSCLLPAGGLKGMDLVGDSEVGLAGDDGLVRHSAHRLIELSNVSAEDPAGRRGTSTE